MIAGITIQACRGNTGCKYDKNANPNLIGQIVLRKGACLRVIGRKGFLAKSSIPGFLCLPYQRKTDGKGHMA